MKKYLFGPVASRRLGISLGVDLIPYKICSFDCIYCESGATTNLTTERKEYYPTQEIIDELEDYLSNQPELDFITFSGNGEPTLHIGIGKIIKYIKEKYPSYKLALITNGTMLLDKKLQNDLLILDMIMPSLDAVTETIINKLNRPCLNYDTDKYIDGLISFRKKFNNAFWLECFLAKGINDSPDELQVIKNIVSIIKPDKFQLNTLDRPPVENFVEPITKHEMEKIKNFFEPIPVEIISKFSYKKKTRKQPTDFENEILSLIKRRPCTKEDFVQTLNATNKEVEEHLEYLLKKKKITIFEGERGIFYRLSNE